MHRLPALIAKHCEALTYTIHAYLAYNATQLILYSNKAYYRFQSISGSDSIYALIFSHLSIKRLGCFSYLGFTFHQPSASHPEIYEYHHSHHLASCLFRSRSLYLRDSAISDAHVLFCLHSRALSSATQLRRYHQRIVRQTNPNFGFHQQDLRTYSSQYSYSIITINMNHANLLSTEL